ncbi:DUF202 domain-containing protein [Priestia flexa]|jgi:putative membrane protein|uniref:DUF202 domain-containing protein n=2 Tax=Priestia TaxID=2800373 RepID=A0A0V8JIK1_9BACI|nr:MULTISPECIES: DUF202 domain-containing protein [Bacillaceae]AQX54788.1 hypothetical protein BC359_11050 [Priestia flexa]KSU86496.1 hypothetical protein AS180_18295 [Priestia veravalensis]KZB90461.1 hypothetical protein A2U94_15910 [Bacillus sp. VT 712]MBN8252045.1 DUF202 domain-containing protein [Priestia flexa]MBN8434991.1 DUF202 domain-containing protein [Priestia flexa]
MSNQDIKAKETTKDSKYIQQHLANERTFLAWLRTAISIIGVGFLVTNLHFTMRATLSPLGDQLATIIGILSVGVGIVTIIVSAVAYVRKIEAINSQTFRPAVISMVLLGVFVIIISLIFGTYFFII